MHLAPPDPLLDALIPRFVGEWACAAAGQAPVCYVDAFAGAEWVFGMGDPGRGDGSRAVSAVLAAVEAGAGCVLVEEDPALLARLRLDLRRRAPGLPLRDDIGPAGLAAGEVALLEADFRNVADLVAALPEGARMLLWAAPPAARRLPWPLLHALLADPAAELLLRFPTADFLKQGALGGPLADLPPFARRLVEGCSALLGDPRHGWIAPWRATQRTYGEHAALEEALEGFTGRLRAAAGERLVKPVHLPGGERLILVTGSPAAALALNGAVVDAGVAPVPADQEDTAARTLDLFPDAARAALARLDPAPALAEHWLERHRGETVPLRTLMAGIATTGATSDDVRRALARLRRSGHAVYRSLRVAEAAVVFPETPSPPAGPRRAPRPAGSGDLFEPAGDAGAQYGS